MWWWVLWLVVVVGVMTERVAAAVRAGKNSACGDHLSFQQIL